jgi:uncharacterized BrkB/YihY/UPF0761 family membrane protein
VELIIRFHSNFFIMISTILYIVGLVLAILAAIDIFKKNIGLGWKILWAVIVLATSWLGLICYYLFLKQNLEKWCK